MRGQEIDLERIRAETPGCRHVAHLDNARASLPPKSVLDAVVDHLRREAEIGSDEAAHEREQVWEKTYDAVAAFIGAGRDEIALIQNPTWAWSMIFHALELRPGDRILTGRADFAETWLPLEQVTERRGAVIDVVPDDANGQIDVGALEGLLDGRVRLVSLVHAPMQSGLVNPVQEVGLLTRAAGVPLVVDARQSVGQLPVRVNEIGCDILMATGNKFLRGPGGTGFMFLRRGVMDQLVGSPLGMQPVERQRSKTYRIREGPRRFESSDTYRAGEIGLGVAVNYATAVGIDRSWQRIQALAAMLRAQLAEIPGVVVGDRGSVLGATSTFSIQGKRARDVRNALARKAINVSQVEGCSSRAELGVNEFVRASVHYFNSESELDRFIEATKTEARRGR